MIIGIVLQFPIVIVYNAILCVFCTLNYLQVSYLTVTYTVHHLYCMHHTSYNIVTSGWLLSRSSSESSVTCGQSRTSSVRNS